jgi:hypothetical protein
MSTGNHCKRVFPDRKSPARNDRASDILEYPPMSVSPARVCTTSSNTSWTCIKPKRMRPQIHSSLLSTSKAQYRSGRLTCISPKHVAFRFRIVVFSIRLMKWPLLLLMEEMRTFFVERHLAIRIQMIGCVCLRTRFKEYSNRRYPRPGNGWPGWMREEAWYGRQ